MSRLIGHKLLLSRELLYLATTGHIPDTPWEPPDPGGLQQQDQRHARLRPSADCSPGKLENPCPAPQIIKGSGARGEEDWKPRRKVSQSGGWEGRGSHEVATLQASKGEERTLHQQFSTHQLVEERKETRCPRTTVWKLAWKGHTWFVLVADWTWRALLPQDHKASCPRRARAGRGDCRAQPPAGSLGSHVVLRAGHNDIPGPTGHGSLSLEILSPRGAGLAKYSHGLVSWWTCHVGPTSPPRSSSCSPFGPGQRFLSDFLTSLPALQPAQYLLTSRCWVPGIQLCKERMNELKKKKVVIWVGQPWKALPYSVV